MHAYLVTLLARDRQAEIRREAQPRQMQLGSFQNEEEELLAIDNESRMSDELEDEMRETPRSFIGRLLRV